MKTLLDDPREVTSVLFLININDDIESNIPDEWWINLAQNDPKLFLQFYNTCKKENIKEKIEPYTMLAELAL